MQIFSFFLFLERAKIRKLFLFCQNLGINLFVQIFEHIENDIFKMRFFVFGKILSNRLHRDFGGQTVRETKLARRDAAERQTFEAVFVGAGHDVAIAGGQLLLLEISGNAIGNNRPDSMDDITTRQVISLRDFGMAGRFLVALTLHQFVTFLAQLHARRRMDGIVDATMQRIKTAQHLAVGRIHDGIDAQAGDVALP